MGERKGKEGKGNGEWAREWAREWEWGMGRNLGERETATWQGEQSKSLESKWHQKLQ